MSAALKQDIQFDYPPTHVCLKKPCAYCLVRSGRTIPQQHQVRFMSESKRTLMFKLVDQLPALDEPQLEAVSYVVQGMIEDAPKPQPQHVPERRKRPRLVFSNRLE